MKIKPKYYNAYKSFTIWGICFLVLAYLIADRHRYTGTFNWMTPLWADQAGYYVYLPGLFIYDFNPHLFPEGIEEKTGEGFSLDLENNKVVTRYPSGVAILQAPFFLTIHAVAGVIDQPRDGFSGIYHKVPNWAALFYTILGFIFLWKFLLFYFKPHIVLSTLVILFFGTNIYYYAVDSTGMSHIYSFSLFATAAWVTKRMLMANKKKQLSYLVIWSLLFALIVLVRPTNLFIFPFLFTLGLHSLQELWERIKQFATFRNILVVSGAFILVFLPQFLYWKYVSGSYIYYSYEEYGFSNLTSPKILELWFSPNNGMFLYSPLYLLIAVGMIVKLFHRTNRLNDWVIFGTFLVLSYVFASWFIFSFGCGYGSRNFVEYNVMFAIPFGYLISRTDLWSFIKRLLFTAFIAILVYFNLKLIQSYDRCFSGGDWDFQKYASYIVKLKKYKQELELNETEKKILPSMEFSKALHLSLNNIHYINFSKAVVHAEVTVENENSEALLVLAIENTDSLVYWNSYMLRDQIPANKLNRPHQIEGAFWLPVPLPENSILSTYIWNRENGTLTLNKLKLVLE